MRLELIQGQAGVDELDRYRVPGDSSHQELLDDARSVLREFMEVELLGEPIDGSPRDGDLEVDYEQELARFNRNLWGMVEVTATAAEAFAQTIACSVGDIHRSTRELSADYMFARLFGKEAVGPFVMDFDTNPGLWGVEIIGAEEIDLCLKLAESLAAAVVDEIMAKKRLESVT